MKDKNAALKLSVIVLLEALFLKNPKNFKTGLKALVPNIVKLTDDATGEVREKSIAMLGKLKNEFG